MPPVTFAPGVLNSEPPTPIGLPCASRDVNNPVPYLLPNCTNRFFEIDLSIAAGSTQTITTTVLDTVSLAQGTGYVKPTVVTTDATLGKNNRFLVDKFMTTDHTNYIVQATYEDGAGFDYTNLQEEIDVEVSGCAADSFYFRLVNKKGIPLTNLRLAKMGTLKLKFERSDFIL